MVMKETDGGAGGKKDCFIATAAYGSPIAPQVKFLKNIRDKGLRKSRVGFLLVEGYEWFYYKFSPQIAGVMYQNRHFRNFIRWLIVNPIVYILTSIIKPLYVMRKKIQKIS